MFDKEECRKWTHGTTTWAMVFYEYGFDIVLRLMFCLENEIVNSCRNFIVFNFCRKLYNNDWEAHIWTNICPVAAVSCIFIRFPGAALYIVKYISIPKTMPYVLMKSCWRLGLMEDTDIFLNFSVFLSTRQESVFFSSPTKLDDEKRQLVVID